MRALLVTLLLHTAPAPPAGTGASASGEQGAPGSRAASARGEAGALKSAGSVAASARGEAGALKSAGPVAVSARGEAGALDAVPAAAETRAPRLRQEVARVALAQVKAPDAAWQPAQRDCAGLIRYAFRTAYRRVASERLAAPLWRDARGAPADFADAETLLSKSFVALGRDTAARDGLRTGDVVAFRQEHDAGPVFHLMLVVRPEDRAHAPARVVYHPGEPGAAVRTGVLDSLATDAPLEWRPVPANTAFLGFFRFKEWMS